jgi:prenyltransferase beta subunit
MPDDTMPPGFSKNTPEQIDQLHSAARAALASLDGSIHAAALVIVLPDGAVTAALGGDDLAALALLASCGGDVLTETVKRFLAGKGTTRIVPR